MNYETIDMEHKTAEQIQKEGKKLKEYRSLMGLKQKYVADLLDTNQPNYSAMESGRVNCGDRLEIVKDMFESWRVKEIELLTLRIKWLQTYN